MRSFPMSLLAATLLGSVPTAATAKHPLALEEGDTALADCLEDPECGDRATRLIAETMTEYGVVLQSDPQSISALGGRGAGPIFEIRLDTATLGRQNALEQRITRIPGLPRISGGWLLGSPAWDSKTPQLALGATVLPSIRVGSGLITTVQLDASGAIPVVGPWLWVGTSVSYGASVVQLPMIGTENQLDGLEEATGATIERTDTCADGCLDRYGQRTATARAGLSIEPTPHVFAYSRVALASVRGVLDVQYDQSTWGLHQLQVQSQSGLGLRVGNYQATLGAVVVPRRADIATGPERTITKLTASSSLRLGSPRARHAEPEAAPRRGGF